jgi:hypothetical protein
MSELKLQSVSNETVEQLAVLANQAGMTLDEYHQQVLSLWINFTKLSNGAFPDTLPSLANACSQSTALNRNSNGAAAASIEESNTTKVSFVEHLLNMPVLEGYENEDIFARSDESIRDLDL